jgi:hypothetical protein
MAIDYLRRTVKGPDAGKKFAAAGLFEAAPEDMEALSALDEAGVAKALDQMEIGYRDTLTAWDASDHEKALKGVETKTVRGDYGILAKVLIPAMGRAKAGDVKAANRVREVLQILSNAKHTPAGEEADGN